MRLRADLVVPDGAEAGDTYYLTINKPFAFLGISTPLEVKGSNGDVFALVKGVRPPASLDGSGKWNKLEIVLLPSAQTSVGVTGFFDIALSYYSGKSDDTKKVVVSLSDSTVLAESATAFTAPKSDPAAACMNPVMSNGPANVSVPELGRSVPGLALAVVFGQGWEPNGSVFTVTPTGAAKTDTHPTCRVAISHEGFNADGYWDRTLFRETLDATTCDRDTGVVTVGSDIFDQLEIPNQATGGKFRVQVFYYADEENTPYSAYNAKLTPGSTPEYEGRPFSLTANNQAVTSYNPPSAGGSSLTLFTTKTSNVDPAATTPLTKGDEIEYVVEVKPGEENGGVISNVVIEDSFPAELEFISATGGGTFDETTGKVTWTEDYLVSSGSFAYTVVAKIKEVPKSGQITNSVNVTTSGAVCGAADTTSVCTASVTDDVGDPSFEFTKNSTITDTNDNGFLGDEGDTIVYTFTVENTGDVIIDTAKLTDDLLGLSDFECLEANSPLEPGESTLCQGTHEYVITQADAENGSVTNEATLCVDPEIGLDCETDTTTNEAVIPGFSFLKHSRVVQQDPSLEGAVAGDSIEYWYTVSNTGTAEINKPITVDDALLGLTDAACVPSLAVGATDVECETTGTYVITEDDVAEGEVVNQATGKVPGLDSIVSKTVNEVLTQSFEFQKHSEVIPAGENRGFEGITAGDMIEYWFTVSNTGEVTLKDLTITDDLLGLDGAVCVSDLAVGAVDVECDTTGTYVITEEDAKAGEVVNYATANVPGLPPMADQELTALVDPSFNFVKSISKVTGAEGKAITGNANIGDTIYYAFEAENTGDVDLTSLLVTDELLGVDAIECLPEGEILAVGERISCADNELYKHAVTAEDAKAGKVDNVATGTVPGLSGVASDVTIKVNPDPSTLPTTGASSVG